MTDQAGPSDWDRAYQKQTDLLRAQLNALHSGPKERLRRFRRLEYVCQGCGDIFLEVLATSPYWVVVTNAIEAHPSASIGVRERPSAGFTSVADARAHYAQQPRELEIRSGGRKFVPFVPESDAARRWSLASSCRCRQWDIPAVKVGDDLAAHKRRRTWPARVSDAVD